MMATETMDFCLSDEALAEHAHLRVELMKKSDVVWGELSTNEATDLIGEIGVQALNTVREQFRERGAFFGQALTLVDGRADSNDIMMELSRRSLAFTMALVARMDSESSSGSSAGG